ncbi:MAG: transposase [Gammaproteobacteria bacterium]|nr:transposase [Gammaproteobacteria bacterium]
MPDYRRNRIPGGCYFFTANLLERHQNKLLVEEIHLLRRVVKQTKVRYPFHIDGWVVLPEHMHFILTLPTGDDDFVKRIRLIKTLFARRIPKTEYRSKIRRRRGERGIWQRRYWEHTIRDELDYARHMDYLHYNPVKHGYVEQVKDWPYSSFHSLVKAQVYSVDWAGCVNDLDVGESD